MTNLITRFDTTTRPATDEADEREVVRFFEKRKLIGELDIEEIVRDDWEDALATFITEQPTTVDMAMIYLQNDLDADDRTDGDDAPGSIVPEKYRILYGAEQNCGDEIAIALTDFVTKPRTSRKETDGGLDRAKLRAVAEVNNIGDKLAMWEDRDLNGGLLRMNTSNVLRGMNRRGERVEIGSQVWEAREVPKKVRKPRAKKA